MSIDRLADLADAASAPRLVVKVGSSLLVGQRGAVRGDWLDSLVRELAQPSNHVLLLTRLVPPRVKENPRPA